MNSAGTFAFFGTPRFAAVILKRLIEAGIPPKLLVTNPDRPVGRKKTLTAPATKRVVLDTDAPVDIIQPEGLDEAVSEHLADFDYFVVAAYSKIIPKRILSLPRKGVIGIHPSLLPKFRGASPIQSVLLSGENETGTTLYLMDEKVDHGSILAQQHLTGVSLNTLTYSELEERLAELSADLLLETLPRFWADEVSGKPQADANATFTKKFVSQDGFVEYGDLTEAQEHGGDKAIAIDQKIRALNPEPGTWTMENGARMKLLGAKLLADGKLRLTKIQYEGKTPQDVGA